MALKQLTFSAPETTTHIALQKKCRSVDSGALQGSFRVWVGHLLLPEVFTFVIWLFREDCNR
jgi:hypothetical protein